MSEQIIIKEISEREVWVGENHLYLENNIVYDIAKGDTNETIALGIKEVVLKFADTHNGKVNLFVDLTDAGKPSPEARKIYKAISENDKIGKIALAGLHPVARILAASLITISGKKDLRFFKTKEESIVWLTEK